MVRAPSRSAVSHLHVVATQAATSSDHAPLIERAVEIEVLGGAVRCLTEGDGGVVVLDAPAGLGKTALLEHTASPPPPPLPGARGVSAAKVVATMEVPASHQETSRPEMKNSSVLPLARRR